MTYDRYYNLISRIASAKNFVLRHKIIFSALLCAVLALITAFIYSCGIFISPVTSEASIYGEPVTFGAKALFSSVSYDFLDKETGLWQDDVPFMPGEYTVRANTVNAFGVKRTSESDFSIGIRDASVTVNDATVVYGDHVYTVRSEGLAKGDAIGEITYIADKEPTENGSVEVNTFKIFNSDGDDVSSAYSVTLTEGNLVVQPRPVTLSVKRVSKEYDATPITPTDWYIASGSLAEGDRAIVTFEGTQTEIGTSESIITSFKIINEQGKDVTYCYSASAEPGIVEVRQINLVFTTGSLSAEYDGTNKICHTYEFTSEKLFGNDKLDESTVVFGTSVVAAGEYRNMLVSSESIKIYDSVTGEDVSSRYSFTVNEGIINISKRNITIKTDSIEREYSGENISDRGEPHVTVGSLAATDVIESYTPEGTIVNVGSIKNGIIVSSIINQNTKVNVAASYNITYEYGDLTVVKRKVTVKSPDLSKVYDGYPLIPEGGLVFVEGELAKLDKLSCTYENTITDVGSKENSFKLSLSTKNPDVTDVDSNYELTVLTGTLRIYPREVTLKSPVSIFKYDGKTHFTGKDLYVYDGSVVYGHTVKVLTLSSITDVGVVENIFTADILNSAGNSVARNYSINCMYGYLVVLESESQGIGEIEIFGEEPYDYNINPPRLAIPDATPPNQNEDDDNVDYTPPVPPENQGGNQGQNSPVLPPQLQYPSQGEDENSGDSSGGENDKDEPIFYVFTDKKQTLFLRGTSYSDYNGVSWEAGVPYVNNYRTKNPLLYASDRLKAIPGFSAKTYELKIKGTTDFYSTYFSTSFPSRLLSDVANVADTSEYSVFFYDFDETRELLYNSDPISNKEIDEYSKWVYANYLSIDPTLRDQLIAIAAENGVYGNSPTLISDVVYYLKKTAKYNLSYKAYPEDQDTIIYFLTVAKEGICIHYAGAAALLYRAYGIPARVAVGYKCESKAGEWTPVTAPAHAWVEIYIDGAWYPIEATPSGSGSNLSSFPEDPLFKNQNAYPEFRPEITVEVVSMKKYYDGKMLRAPEIRVTGDKLKAGHRLIARSDATITYVGTVEAKCDLLQIIDESGNDVSSEYCIRIREGTLTVLPIAPQSVQKIIYMNSGDIIIPAKRLLVDLYFGEETRITSIPEFLIGGMIQVEGSGVSVFRLDSTDSDPPLDTFRLSGTGTATVIVPLKSLDVNGDRIVEYAGTTVIVTIEVGHFSNVRFRNVSLLTALENGSIDISKRNSYVPYVDENGKEFSYLVLATTSAVKNFDGTPLVSEGVDVMCGALFEGHSIHAVNSGTRTYVGKINNTCSELRIFDVNGNDVTYMYSIDLFYGSLEVTSSKAKTDISDISIEKNEEYDLSALNWSHLIGNYPLTATVTDGGKFAIVENSRIVGIKQGGSVVEVRLAAVDMNFDGLLEYDNVVYTFNVNVTDPNLYENMFVIVFVAVIAMALVSLSVFLKLRLGRKAVTVSGISDASDEEVLGQEQSKPSGEGNDSSQ